MKTKMLMTVLLGSALMMSAAPAPVRAEDTVAAPAAQASAFAGIWKVQDGKGRDFYITLASGGQATSSWTGAEDQRRNQTGTWVEADGKAVVTWANGWREVLENKDGAVVKKAYAPKLQLEGEPANTSPAVKVESIPAR